MARPREIAAQMFNEVATEVASHSFDLVSVLKRGWRACELAGMPAEQRWFELELRGYRQPKLRLGAASCEGLSGCSPP